MSMVDPSWTELDGNLESELRALKNSVNYDPGYRVVPQSEIPGIFSLALKNKCNSAVVMTSTGAHGTVIFVCNALRVDRKAGAIDQEPFGIALLSSTGAAGSGVFLHHGNWEGRTSRGLPDQFWEQVAASGVGNFFPGNHLPLCSTGALSNLSGTSHGHAFLKVFETLKLSGQVG